MQRLHLRGEGRRAGGLCRLRADAEDARPTAGRGRERSVELDLGLVVAGHGRHYVVETPEGRRITCHPRGKKSDCVVGDRVRWMPTGDEGVIEHVEPRRNLLFRQDEWKTKSFAANLDQLLVLVAARADVQRVAAGAGADRGRERRDPGRASR